MKDQLLILPHDEEAERCMLGACLISNAALELASTIVTPSDFYSQKRTKIFRAMLQINQDRGVLDSITLADFMEQDGTLKLIGGRAELSDNIEAMPSASNVSKHAIIVRQHAMRRAILKLSISVMDRVQLMEEPTLIAASAQSELLALVFGRENREWKTGGEVSTEGLEWMNRAADQSDDALGITSGLTALDNMTGGWQRGDLVVVGARPSMGKTGFATVAGLAGAMAGNTVGMFSLEMSVLQLGMRFLSRQAKLNLFALRTPRTLSTDNWLSLAQASAELQPAPFFIDDSPMLTLDSMRAKARALKGRVGLDVLIVDYLQLIDLPHGESRQVGLTEASRGFKLLAKELDMTVILLSQLSRECERREDRRPILSDLRESGAIEQDADMVLMLYRDEVYNKNVSGNEGRAEILIRKHRNGPTGDIEVRFVAETASFENQRA